MKFNTMCSSNEKLYASPPLFIYSFFYDARSLKHKETLGHELIENK